MESNRNKDQNEIELDALNKAECSVYMHLFTVRSNVIFFCLEFFILQYINIITLLPIINYNNLLQRSCTILGYCIYLAVACTLFVFLIGLPDLTDSKYLNGLPKVNVLKQTIYLSFFVAFVGMFCLFSLYINSRISSGLPGNVMSLMKFLLYTLLVSFGCCFSIHFPMNFYWGIDNSITEPITFLIGCIIMCYLCFFVYLPIEKSERRKYLQSDSIQSKINTHTSSKIEFKKKIGDNTSSQQFNLLFL